MSDFLKLWDEAYKAASTYRGGPAEIWAVEKKSRSVEVHVESPFTLSSLVNEASSINVWTYRRENHLSARTMHPAFMGKPVPKHDPERDQ